MTIGRHLKQFIAAAVTDSAFHAANTELICELFETAATNGVPSAGGDSELFGLFLALLPRLLAAVGRPFSAGLSLHARLAAAPPPTAEQRLQLVAVTLGAVSRRSAALSAAELASLCGALALCEGTQFGFELLPGPISFLFKAANLEFCAAAALPSTIFPALNALLAKPFEEFGGEFEEWQTRVLNESVGGAKSAVSTRAQSFAERLRQLIDALQRGEKWRKYSAAIALQAFCTFANAFCLFAARVPCETALIGCFARLSVDLLCADAISLPFEIECAAVRWTRALPPTSIVAKTLRGERERLFGAVLAAKPSLSAMRALSLLTANLRGDCPFWAIRKLADFAAVDATAAKVVDARGEFAFEGFAAFRRRKLARALAAKRGAVIAHFAAFVPRLACDAERTAAFAEFVVRVAGDDLRFVSLINDFFADLLRFQQKVRLIGSASLSEIENELFAVENRVAFLKSVLSLAFIVLILALRCPRRLFDGAFLPFFAEFDFELFRANATAAPRCERFFAELRCVVLARLARGRRRRVALAALGELAEFAAPVGALGFALWQFAAESRAASLSESMLASKEEFFLAVKSCDVARTERSFRLFRNYVWILGCERPLSASGVQSLLDCLEHFLAERSAQPLSMLSPLVAALRLFLRNKSVFASVAQNCADARRHPINRLRRFFALLFAAARGDVQVGAVGLFEAARRAMPLLCNAEALREGGEIALAENDDEGVETPNALAALLFEQRDFLAECVAGNNVRLAMESEFGRRFLASPPNSPAERRARDAFKSALLLRFSALPNLDDFLTRQLSSLKTFSEGAFERRPNAPGIPARLFAAATRFLAAALRLTSFDFFGERDSPLCQSAFYLFLEEEWEHLPNLRAAADVARLTRAGALGDWPAARKRLLEIARPRPAESAVIAEEKERIWKEFGECKILI